MLRAGDLSNIQEAEFRIFREIVGQKEFQKSARSEAQRLR